MLASQTHGLITKGLGLPASKGLITMFFTLFVTDHVIPPTPSTGGGGGHIPVSMSSIRSAQYTYSPQRRAVQMRNVPIPQNRAKISVPYYMPKRTGDQHKRITIKVTLGSKESTHEYLASDKAGMKVKVSGLFTQLDESIKIIAEGLFNKINIKK